MAVVMTVVNAKGMDGQFLFRWLPPKCDGCLVLDDEVALTESLAFVYKNTAPENLPVHLLSVAQAVTKLPEAVASAKSYVLLLRSPAPLERLRQAGVALDFMRELFIVSTLNAGELHPVAGSWSCTREELRAVDQLDLLGIDVHFQLVPEAPSHDWVNLRRHFTRLLD